MKQFSLSVIIFISALLSSWAQPTELQTLPTDPAVRTGMLDSGIKYYLRQNKKTAQRADFHIIYNVGSIQEEDRQDGLAHFLEHMAFNGSRNFPENTMVDYLQSIGVVFNAGTGQQSTQYMITSVPTTRQGIIDSVLLVLHDWAGFISLNQDDIDNERGVIQEELRLYEGKASERVRREQMKLLFGEDNIYARRNMIGTIKGLQTFTYADIRDFYNKWYRPDMQAFVIVGDFDVDSMEDCLRRTMSDIRPSANKTPKDIVIVDENTTPRVGIVTDPELTQTSVELTFRHEPLPHEIRNTVQAKHKDMMEKFASNMLNIRLHSISSKPDAPFVSSGASYDRYFEPFDMFSLWTSSREGEALSAFRAAYTELLRVDRHGFIQAELDRMKADYLSSIEQWYANRNDRLNGELTSDLIDNFLDNSPYMSAEQSLHVNRALVESITLDDLNRFASSLVVDKNITLMLSAQSKPEITQPTPAELLSVMTDVEALDITPYNEVATATSLLDHKKLKGSKLAKQEEGKFESTVWTLKNGIRVVVKPTEYKTDEIVLEAIKLGGTSTIASVDDLYSINMASNFLSMSGVANFSQIDLMRILSGKQVSLTPFVDDVYTGYRGSSSKSDLETMLQLTYLYATAPRFDTSDWNTLVDKYKTSITGANKNPDRIFRDSLTSTMYANNPRKAPLTVEILERSTLARFISTYKRLFASAHGMTFFLTGSIDKETLLPLIEKYIGSLPAAKSKTAPQIGTHIEHIHSRIVDNTFTTVQEAGRVSTAFVSTGSVNYSLAEKLNLEVAGQTLNNIYTKTIREAKGGAYVVQNSMSVGSIPIQQFINLTFFMTDTSKLAMLIPEVQAGIDSVLTHGPSTEELTKATETMGKQFTQDNQHNATWSNYLVSYYIFNRDNYSTYQDELRRLSPTTVQQAAKRAFGQENRLIITQLPAASK